MTDNKNQSVLAWHFLNDDKTMSFDRFGEVVEVGKTYSIPEDKNPEVGVYGLHGAGRAIDAIKHSNKTMVCRVEIYDDISNIDTSVDIYNGPTLLAGRHRKVLWMADASKTLKEFARWCILQVIDLLPVPDVVQRYLETGDESLFKATYDAVYHADWHPACTIIFNSPAYRAAWSVACEIAHDAAINGADRGTVRADVLEKQNAKLEEMLLSLTAKEINGI